MPSILFHAIEPPPPSSKWRNFSNETQVTMLNEYGVEHLSIGVWLVALPDTRKVVDRLADAARRNGISFRLLQVEHDGGWPPQWLMDQ